MLVTLATEQSDVFESWAMSARMALAIGIFLYMIPLSVNTPTEGTAMADHLFDDAFCSCRSSFCFLEPLKFR